MEADEQNEPVQGQEGSSAEDAGSSSDADTLAGLKGTRSLRRLRDRVERVAQELLMLREENAVLQERIVELESMPAEVGEGGVRLLETDPEALKRKVEGFIEAIDRYLEEKEPAG